MLGTGDVLEDLEDIVSGNSSSVMDMSTVTINMLSFLQVGTSLILSYLQHTLLRIERFTQCMDRHFIPIINMNLSTKIITPL